MAVEKLNPAALAEPAGFMHVAIAQGTKLVFLAGQVAQDKDGNLVGEGDLAAQTAQVVRNVHAGLEAAGATFEDVVNLTLYVVDWHEDKMDQLMAGVVAAAGELGSAPVVPSTLVPVARLFEPGYLIEIQASAVIG